MFQLFPRSGTTERRAKLIEKEDNSRFTPTAITNLYNSMSKFVNELLPQIANDGQRQWYENEWGELKIAVIRVCAEYRQPSNADTIYNIQDKIKVLYLQIAQFGDNLRQLIDGNDGE